MRSISPHLPLSDLQLKGLGPVTVARLKARGLVRVSDVLYFFPLHYNDLTQVRSISALTAGETVSVQVTIDDCRHRITRPRRLAITEAVVSDDSGTMKVTWFNQPWLKDRLRKGQRLVLFGKVETARGGGITMTNPVIRPAGSGVGKLAVEPVYSAVQRVSNGFLQMLARHCIESVLPCRFDIPEELIARYRFPDKRDCFRTIHFPPDSRAVQAIESHQSPALRALIYEEFFSFFVGVMAARHRMTAVQKAPMTVNETLRTWMRDLIPFTLTGDQQRVVDAMYREFAAGRRLVRLVQGDVGSGKTVVALLGALPFVKQGSQVAFLAPTEILAEQHFRTLGELLADTGIPVALMTGGTRTADRRRILEGLADGSLPLVVGTHALFQDDVTFRDLQFVVIDEQHRFGVEQREAMVAKGREPHILSLTATPIPRTLAMTLYGQYDTDVIRSRPAGRKDVRTVVKKMENADEVYRFVREMVQRKGYQAYLVYPLIEDSEELDAASAVSRYEELKGRWFHDVPTALVHGRLKAEERQEIMARFKAGTVKVLFATTVIEVGVDVPNANIMVIENAERFGLSQLHQLRGRIGRGDMQAYCFLVVGQLKGEDAYRRVMIMAKTTDGFRISEEDLKIRGPGEFLGTRQSGIPEFRVGDIFRDRELLQQAREDARQVVAEGRLDFLDADQWRDRFGRTLV